MWHLGCVASVCLAELGNKVTCTDFDPKTILNLQKGLPPLFEPKLENFIKKNIKRARLNFTNNFKEAVTNSDYFFITFDTPVNEKDKSDLTLIYDACKLIAQYSTSKNPYIVIVSQVPVGTCEKLKDLIRKENSNLIPKIIYNPENIRLGNAIKTFMFPDRIIIGSENKKDANKLIHLYKKIKSPKYVMSLESAEMVKHALNSYLATSISFVNEIANLCEVTGANVSDVVKGLKSDKRISKNAPLNPGLGFAGGTLARDIQVLIKVGKKYKVKTKIINATLEVNNGRIKQTLNKIKSASNDLKEIKGGILGLTYKPGTSTLRRSISVELAKTLQKAGISIKAYDPMISNGVNNGDTLKSIKLVKSPYDAAKDSNFLLIATEWPEFKNLDLKRIYSLMLNGKTKPVLIDTKNFLNPAWVSKNGFQYVGTGISCSSNDK